MNQLTRLFSVFLILILIAACGRNKPSEPSKPESPIRKSPIAIASIKYQQTYVKIVYGQPYRNGRTIFGEWEKYGEVWRTGANEATEITITRPILMNTRTVDAGTYALFTIPNEESWTIILSTQLGLWGAFEYDPTFDYLRFEVPVTKLDEPVEVFTISFTDTFENTTTLAMEWDRVRVEIPIRFFEE